MNINKSPIDYLQRQILFPATGRTGGTLNIITGCKHHETGVCNVTDCYARRMVLHGRLKGHKSYPYGFDPTFHPDRIRKIGGKPKLIFLNDMGDVGGDWPWRLVNAISSFDPERIAGFMRDFAILNPRHIILLLTKNPAWYRFAEWPDNVMCGFSATNNEELETRLHAIVHETKVSQEHLWISCEPWLDDNHPYYGTPTDTWLVIGGLSGKNARPVSEATIEWLRHGEVQAKIFTKANAIEPLGYWPEDPEFPREYPEAWEVANG